jgi:integrase
MPKLTEKYIQKLKPREGRKQYDVCDKLPGFGLCYSNGGARTFFVFWRGLDSGNRRQSIGRHDRGMSANQARAVARAKLAEIDAQKKAGIDRPTERLAPTLGDLIERYLKYAPDRLAASTLKQCKWIIGRSFTQELRAQKLDSFTREQIEDLHREIGNTRGKLAANNWLRRTRHMFNLGRNWKMYAGDNQCARVQLFKETERTRHLSDEEAVRLNDALLKDPDWRWRAFFPLLLHTGLRKSELLALTWNRVDFNKRTATIERTKNGKILAQPLVELAMQILMGLPSRGTSAFVFPANRPEKHLVAPEYAWKKIRDRAGIPDLHIHDLRHSFASFLINAGVPIVVVSKALNHSSLTMTQRYAHLENETVRSAMEETTALRIGRMSAAPAAVETEAQVVS